MRYPHWPVILVLSMPLFSASSALPGNENLLPNASFELGFGEHMPTHWLDYQNQFTLKLLVHGQVPATQPTLVDEKEAPDGQHAVRLSLTPDRPAHLPSPLLAIRPAQAYTLSIFARSSEPTARLQLTLWTRSMNLSEPPDIFSPQYTLSPQWKRYDFHFVTEEFMRQAVVDIVVTSNRASDVIVDAVQLEEGAITSPFHTRSPVEGVLFGRRDHVALHFMDEPLVVYTTLYNQTGQVLNDSLEIRFETLFGGKHLFSRTIASPIATGIHEHKVTVDPAPLGRFRARLFSSQGVEVGVDDYPFIVHPVMDDDFQGVLFSDNGKVGTLPAERNILPWSNQRNWYADPPQNLVLTDNDLIYVPLADGTHLARSDDGGRTWIILEVPLGDGEYVDLGYAGVGFFRNGTFLRAFWKMEASQVEFRASQDEGKTWTTLGYIDGVNSPPQFAPVLERPDGTLVWAIHHEVAGQPGTTYAYHSNDRGHTWSRPFPIAPGGEPTISELQSGRLIALVRHNPPIPHLSYVDRLPFENYTAWRFSQRNRNAKDVKSWTKRVLLARSDDGGKNWETIGPGSLMVGEMHGGTVELPDGRLLLHHTHRAPTHRGGEWVRISDNGGKSFEDRTYYMTATQQYPGYATMRVLPPRLADGKKGMVLSVVGERGRPGRPARLQAIRWRPLPR